MLATSAGSLRGRLVAEADSVLGLTAPLSAPPTEVRPSRAVDWEATVSEVAPSPMKWLITEAGTVTWAAGAVWKVPPASMLAGGAGDSDTTTGKVARAESRRQLQVNGVAVERDADRRRPTRRVTTHPRGAEARSPAAAAAGSGRIPTTASSAHVSAASTAAAVTAAAEWSADSAGATGTGLAGGSVAARRAATATDPPGGTGRLRTSSITGPTSSAAGNTTCAANPVEAVAAPATAPAATATGDDEPRIPGTGGEPASGGRLGPDIG